MAALVQTEALFSGRPGQFGLSPRAMRATFALERPDAEALLTWFELAGLLESPRSPVQPWNTPRPLITRDLRQVARQLAATHLPTPSDIASAFPKG